MPSALGVGGTEDGSKEFLIPPDLSQFREDSLVKFAGAFEGRNCSFGHTSTSSRAARSG